MTLTTVQDQAIATRMALGVGAINFDRLFYGIQFDEIYGNVLFAYAKSEQSEAENRGHVRPHISIIATSILKRESAS